VSADLEERASDVVDASDVVGTEKGERLPTGTPARHGLSDSGSYDRRCRSGHESFDV
jgi:hypothetical protein